jgi:hypothetical protein
MRFESGVRTVIVALNGRLLERSASVSRETVCRRMAENNLKPWRKDMWWHSAVRCRIRCWDGGCARSLCRTARSETPSGPLRREPDSAHRRASLAIPARASLSAAIVSMGERNRQPVRVARRPSALFAVCMRELAEVQSPRNCAYPCRSR